MAAAMLFLQAGENSRTGAAALDFMPEILWSTASEK